MHTHEWTSPSSKDLNSTSYPSLMTRMARKFQQPMFSRITVAPLSLTSQDCTWSGAILGKWMTSFHRVRATHARQRVFLATPIST